MKNNISRQYKFDNIKAILIFLVVFAHIIEKSKDLQAVYMFIYSFHMPLFMFVTGYFAGFNRKNIIFRFGYTYFLFQTLYILFDIFILQKTTDFQYTKPKWILWYLFAMTVYFILFPMFDAERIKAYPKRRIAVILLLFLLALFAGFENTLDYDFSASRIVYFLPFFISGYYFKNDEQLKKLFMTFSFMKNIISIVLFLGMPVGTVLWLKYGVDNNILTPRMLYGSYPYEAIDYNLSVRFVIMLVANAWIYIFVLLTPDKYIPLVSDIGRYTLPVFLLHGFIVSYLWKIASEGVIEIGLLSAVAITVIIVLLLGNKTINKFFVNCFTGKFLEKIVDKYLK
ncbi:MAG: acyltransferase family protein [Lachnospiraceae bacterium]|nr:acyltransferase family protein [Lachnospiraceae bacterium]